MANERFFQGNYFDNLGCSLSAGTFTIHGALGRSLSSLNPAYVVLPSKTTPGEFVKYTITADQNFIDDAGSSEIIGNLFGFTTSVAITVDVPFYIYAVANDNEDTIQFMLSRHPHRTTSPATADIGAPDDAVASAEEDFWSFDNIDETAYDENPCLCVGSIRMQMSASDDWTVQTLAFTDGIGQYQETITFTNPLGQFGADASALTIANGGTSAAFSSVASQYAVSTKGYVWYDIFLSGDAGTDGAGAVNAFVTAPFKRNTSSVNIYGMGTGAWGGGTTRVIMFRLSSTNNSMRFIETNTTSDVLWSAFTNGNRSIAGQVYYKLLGT